MLRPPPAMTPPMTVSLQSVAGKRNPGTCRSGDDPQEQRHHDQANGKDPEGHTRAVLVCSHDSSSSAGILRRDHGWLDAEADLDLVHECLEVIDPLGGT